MDALDELLGVRRRALDRRAAPVPLPPPARARGGLSGHARRLAARRAPALRGRARGPRRAPPRAARTTSSRSAATATRTRSRCCSEAGEATAQRTPAGAARWFAAALRLLPPTAPAERRIELLTALARALAATGQFEEAHQALEEELRIVAARRGRAARRAGQRVRDGRAAARPPRGGPRAAGGRAGRARRTRPRARRPGLLIDLGAADFYRVEYAASSAYGARALEIADDTRRPRAASGRARRARARERVREHARGGRAPLHGRPPS